MEGIDTSSFAKLADLLARPLSPTALEQEALDAANGSKQRTPSGAGVGAPNVKTGGAKAKAKAKAKLARAGSRGALNVATTAAVDDGMPSGDVQGAPASEDGTDGPPPQSSNPKNRNSCSILDSVAELSGLQKEWKEKMNSPSHRKAGPPRINRKPEQKVLSEEERKEKMGEIDALEVQLQQARGVAAAASRAAAAAASHVASYAQQSQSAQDAESGSEDHEEENDQAKANKEVGPDDLSRQAEERVRARKRKEAKDRKERERRDAEEKKTKQAEAEAKTKDLERITRERLQEKSRAERAREQQLKEERERESQLKEQRSQAAREELQQLTSKRVAEREQAERQRAEELARHEAEERRLHEEESEAKAMLLREKTRLRVQEHSRDQREHLMAEEEARLRRLEEVAKASEERSQEAQQSQQRARARAADFRQRARLEAEEHARLDEEQLARERERSDAALEERHRKRHYRPGSEPPESHAAPANVRPESPAQPAAAAAQPRRPAAQQAQQQQPQQQQPQQHQQQQQRHQPPAQQVQAHHMPPRPPVERAAGAVGAPEQNTVATKRVQPSRAPAAAAVQRAVGKGAAAGAAGSKVSGQKEARGRRGSEAEVAQGGHGADEESRNWSIAVDDGETVRCNVGFFGMGGDPLDSDGEDEAPQFPDDFGDEGDGYSRPGSGYSALANRRATSSQAGNRGQRAPSAPAAPPFAPPPGPMTRAAVRAYSQPPLNRPQQDVPRGGLSGGGDYSRGSSPGGGADYGGRCFEAEVTSMGAARAALGLPRSPSGSCHSEPVGHAGGHSPALQKPTPWKQRAIQVNSTDYYLDAMKAARGGGQKGGQKPAGNKPAVRTTPNKEGYADQARQHASDVEVRQREEEGARQERGYAVLQRVQQRAAQASPLRGMSCD